MSKLAPSTLAAFTLSAGKPWVELAEHRKCHTSHSPRLCLVCSRAGISGIYLGFGVFALELALYAKDAGIYIDFDVFALELSLDAEDAGRLVSYFALLMTRG